MSEWLRRVEGVHTYNLLSASNIACWSCSSYSDIEVTLRGCRHCTQAVRRCRYPHNLNCLAAPPMNAFNVEAQPTRDRPARHWPHGLWRSSRSAPLCYINSTDMTEGELSEVSAMRFRDIEWSKRGYAEPPNIYQQRNFHRLTPGAGTKSIDSV